MSQRLQAISSIRKVILDGSLPVATRTSERELTDKFLPELGRTAVREALAILAHQGVIEQFPQVGFEVPQVSVDEAVKVLRLQYGVEAVIVRELAQKQADLSPVDAHIEVLKSAASKGDSGTAMASATDVHACFARLGGFFSAVDTLSGFRDRLQICFLGTQPLCDKELLQVAEGHGDVVSAIRADSNGAKAVEALDHLTRVETSLVEGRRKYSRAEPSSPVRRNVA